MYNISMLYRNTINLKSNIIGRFFMISYYILFELWSLWLSTEINSFINHSHSKKGNLLGRNNFSSLKCISVLGIAAHIFCPLCVASHSLLYYLLEIPYLFFSTVIGLFRNGQFLLVDYVKVPEENHGPSKVKLTFLVN